MLAELVRPAEPKSWRRKRILAMWIGKCLGLFVCFVDGCIFYICLDDL